MWNAASSLRHRLNSLTLASYVCEAAPRPLLRVPDRFSGIRDFPYLKLGIRDLGFESKTGERFGIESTRGRWDAKNNPRDYRIASYFGSGLRDWEPYWGPSLFWTHYGLSTKYRKLVSNFLSLWLANRQRHFLTGQSSCVFKSWYTGEGPEQRFRRYFEDGLNQSLVSFVAQAMQSNAHAFHFSR